MKTHIPCPGIRTALAQDVKSVKTAGVYFIQQGPTGPIKIGWSTDVKTRMASLQTSTHEKLVLRFIMVDATEKDEKRLHSWFAAERMSGEWFQSGGQLGEFLAWIDIHRDVYKTRGEWTFSRRDDLDGYHRRCDIDIFSRGTRWFRQRDLRCAGNPSLVAGFAYDAGYFDASVSQGTSRRIVDRLLTSLAGEIDL